MTTKANKTNSKKVKEVELSEIEILKLRLATLEAEKIAAEMQARNEKERADRLGRELYRERHIIDMTPDFLSLVDLTDGLGMNLKTCDDFIMHEGDTDSPLFQAPLHKNRMLSYLYQAGLLLPAFASDIKRALENTKKENIADVRPIQVKERKKIEAHRENLKPAKSERGEKKQTFFTLYKDGKNKDEIRVIMNISDKSYYNYIYQLKNDGLIPR